jgi:acetyl-CoA carboxylase biotin carboxyl carrier protein
LRQRLERAQIFLARAHSVNLTFVTIDEIRELIALANETGVAELEVQRGEDRVRIRRAGFANPQEIVASAVTGVHMAAPPPAAPHAAPHAALQAPPSTVHDPPAKPAGPDPDLTLVKSPIVGTFYESPSPGSAPFVRMGERIQPGKVLCIIESMKLMNEIEAETSGIVESRLVMNGQPVEYGEALFAIRAV